MMPARNYKMVPCVLCGEPFRLPMWEEKRGRKYCSPDCGFSARSSRKGSLHPLDISLVRERVSYTPETGFFAWKIDLPSAKRTSGSQAGYITAEGYRVIGVLGHLVLAHRLAWLMMTGEMPAGEIDHMNGIRDDNRWENLRVVDDRENSENKHFTVGASFEKSSGKWRAQIKAYGRQKTLGRYATLEEARSAYLLEKRKAHSGFTG